MTSNFKLIKRFFELVNEYESARSSKDTNVIDYENQSFGLRYRNYINPDIIIYDDSSWLYLFDYTILSVSAQKLKQETIVICSKDRTDKNLLNNFDKDVINMDDMELLLKHGKKFTDDNILNLLRERLSIDIDIDNFSEYLK